MEKQKIITRAEAIEKGLVNYYTGIPCINGHLSKRRTTNCLCLQCDYERAKEKRALIKAKRAEAMVAQL